MSMNKETIKELSRDIMFDVSEEEVKDIENEFVTLDKMLEFFESINTDGVEEMIYPFEEPTIFLREDKTSNVISQDEAMSNVAKVKQGHVVVPKVVK